MVIRESDNPRKFLREQVQRRMRQDGPMVSLGLMAVVVDDSDWPIEHFTNDLAFVVVVDVQGAAQLGRLRTRWSIFNRTLRLRRRQPTAP